MSLHFVITHWTKVLVALGATSIGVALWLIQINGLYAAAISAAGSGGINGHLLIKPLELETVVGNLVDALRVVIKTKTKIYYLWNVPSGPVVGGYSFGPIISSSEFSFGTISGDGS